MYRLDSTVAITVPVDYDVEPDSSFIERIAYDSANKRCYVAMHGSTYEYENVDEAAFNGLWSAPSVGNEYQYFRSQYGPSTLMGKNIEFEVRNLNNTSDENPWNDMTVGPEADVPLQDASDESEELDLADSISVRALALEYAADIFKGTAAPNSVVLETAVEFESYLLVGNVERA